MSSAKMMTTLGGAAAMGERGAASTKDRTASGQRMIGSGDAGEWVADIITRTRSESEVFRRDHRTNRIGSQDAGFMILFIL
jgi:hypothetical protein